MNPEEEKENELFTEVLRPSFSVFTRFLFEEFKNYLIFVLLVFLLFAILFLVNIYFVFYIFIQLSRKDMGNNSH